MSLSIGGNKSAAKGVYINKATIKTVEDLSHTTLPFINDTFDLAVKLTFDIGKDFEKSITVFGNFKRDTDGQVTGLGAAFKVANIFTAFGIKGDLTPTNDLPAEWLTALKGKECFILDYAIGTKENGKTKFGSFDAIAQDEDTLLEEFQFQLKKGFPKKYIAWLNESDNTQGDAYEPETATEGAPAAEEALAF